MPVQDTEYTVKFDWKQWKRLFPFLKPYKKTIIIMLIGKTTCYHREYRWSREFAEERNIPFINFINHYPNRPEYISERLHKYL
jgi:hypothetical protein